MYQDFGAGGYFRMQVTIMDLEQILNT